MPSVCTVIVTSSGGISANVHDKFKSSWTDCEYGLSVDSEPSIVHLEKAKPLSGTANTSNTSPSAILTECDILASE